MATFAVSVLPLQLYREKWIPQLASLDFSKGLGL